MPTTSEWDAAAALQRLEQVIDTLRTRFVCKGWHPNGLDETAAARALAYFRAGCPEESDEDFAERKAAFGFVSGHGQSIDWIILGDPVGLICRAAEHSRRALAAKADDDAELLALGEKFEPLWNAFVPLCNRRQETYYAVEEFAGLKSDAAHEAEKAYSTATEQARDAMEGLFAITEAIFETQATTLRGFGLHAAARLVRSITASSLVDGSAPASDLLLDLVEASGLTLPVCDRRAWELQRSLEISDPIFAAIEAHRVTWADLRARCSALDEAGISEADAELDRIMAVDNEAAGELADVKPTTLAGAIALLRHSVEISEEYAFEDEEDDKTKPPSHSVESNVADAIERIGGV